MLLSLCRNGAGRAIGVPSVTDQGSKEYSDVPTRGIVNIFCQNGVAF